MPWGNGAPSGGGPSTGGHRLDLIGKVIDLIGLVNNRITIIDNRITIIGQLPIWRWRRGVWPRDNGCFIVGLCQNSINSRSSIIWTKRAPVRALPAEMAYRTGPLLSKWPFWRCGNTERTR